MTVEYKKHSKSDGYISTLPLPSVEELQRFYAEFYYQAPKSSSYQESYDDVEIEYKNLKCNALIYALGSHSSTTGAERTFLDIGAGEGFLLNAADLGGFDVTGIDFSAYGVAKFFPHLVSRHIAGDIYESLQLLIDQGKKFSVCSSTNVLEHVLDPDLFLTSIRQVMEPDAILAITVPNDFSDLQQFALNKGMIDREFWFVPPHHLNYYNTLSLTRYMIDQGFEILDAFSDFPVDLYLLHPGSNYINESGNGSAAHRARMYHDLLIAEKSGLNNYLDYYRGMFKVGLGRDVTVIVRSKEG